VAELSVSSRKRDLGGSLVGAASVLSRLLVVVELANIRRREAFKSNIRGMVNIRIAEHASDSAIRALLIVDK
jgi:hypothetical protein